MSISKQGIEQTRPDVALVQAEVANINGDSIPAMVGTDSAFLANVGGLLTSSAATGAVGSAKLMMAYIKQLVTEGIARDTAIGNIPTTMVGTDSAALASVLGAVNTAAATGAVTTSDEVIAYIKQLITQGVHHRAYKSTMEHIIVIPATGADLAFPSVVVSGLPTGATLVSVELLLVIGAILDTSASENQIKAATTDSLWIKASGGAWGTDDIEALIFKALSLQTKASEYRGGAVLWGAIDVKAEVTGNGTYNIQSRQTDRNKGVEATGGTLELLDVTCILDIWWY